MYGVSSVGRRKASGSTGRRRACDICFQRKIKCDAEFPQCNWCRHHNLACTYNRIAGRIKSRNHINLSPVGNVIQSELSTSSPTKSSSNPPLGSPRLANPHSNVTIFKGIHLLSNEGVEWIEHQTG
ncbi:hypothetical protein M752DRAFT_319267, partial [Aspergillus phoenicis ATCC 13157]